MKQIFTKLIFAFCLLGMHSMLTAQVNVYTEYQLPPSDYLTPFFIGSLTESAIYYGDDSNANLNKPVVVFVHGYIDLANSWFLPGNKMYDKFEDRGFRTAFVATTRGEGMWYNGEMLSYMLDDITAHYNVNDVVIVAHSNGGKASEVAMFSHGKYNKVDRVITLGTPFKGTGLANLAQLPGFEWLVGLVGLGEGAATSTTYYMEGYARPILDNHPDNQPNKFVNFGAWGYGSGNTIFSPIMTSGGLLLNTLGAGPFNGGNDGVTPYYSSKRPGGSQKWPGHCWGWWCNKQSKHDHIDITFSGTSFNYIYPWVNGAALRTSGEEVIADEYERSPMLESNFEIINPKNNDAEQFQVAEITDKVTVNVLYQNEDDAFVIRNEAKEQLGQTNIAKEKLGKGLNTTIQMEAVRKGTYELDTDAKDYIAVVNYENGPTLYYDNTKVAFEENEAVVLHAQIEGTNDAATITGIVAHKNDLSGNEINGETYKVTFKHVGNMQYEYHLPKSLATGTYAVLINANAESFRRTIVAGFVVKDKKTQALIEAADLAISHFPNPVVDATTISFEKEFEGAATLQLFDNYGRLVKMEDISNLATGKQQVEWNMEAINAGSYFLEFKNGEKKTTKQMVILK